MTPDEPHRLAPVGDGWTCSVCRWAWKSRPDTRCPGQPRYTWQTAAMAGLETRTELGWRGSMLAQRQEPAGCVLAGDVRRYYDVYEVSAAMPKREVIPAQLEALARGRAAPLAGRTCVDCGAVFRPEDARYYLDEACRRVLAYNASFDGRILDQTRRRYALPELQPAGWTCAMELFAAWWGDWSDCHGSFRWHKLAAACAIASVDTTGIDLHSAAGDALLTWRLVKQFEGGVCKDGH